MSETITNVVELHPQSIGLFKQNIEQLSDVLSSGQDANLSLVGIFRSWVEAVIIEPRQAGAEYTVQIRGRLAALMGAEVSAIEMVARDRYRLSPHDANLRYFLRSSAKRMGSADGGRLSGASLDGTD
jgi:hypothetical protein